MTLNKKDWQTDCLDSQCDLEVISFKHKLGWKGERYARYFTLFWNQIFNYNIIYQNKISILYIIYNY